MGNKNATKCMKKKNSITFKSDLKVTKGPRKNSTEPILMFFVMYKSAEKIVHEERLIYDRSGMVSQLGGVLSLFLGFSFFSLISDFLDFIAKKNITNSICKKSPQAEPPSP